MSLLEIIPVWIREIPDHLKTQEMCNEAMRMDPYSLAFVPDNLKTQEMCDKALEIDPYNLWRVPNHFKTQKMCDKAAETGPGSLEFVTDWFVTQQQIDVWYDDDYWCNDDEIIEWYNGYQKRKAQKSKIKEELLHTAWHPGYVMDWCMSEDEKRWLK